MEEQQKHKKKKRWKIMMWIGISLAVVVLGVFGYVYIRMMQMNQNAIVIVGKPSAAAVASPASSETLEPVEGTPADIDVDYDVEVPDPTQEPIYKQVKIDENVINILFVGADIRPEQNGNGRSDSMMLFSYNRTTQEAKLVSLMRDVWIHIPGHGYNRINAAYSFGGIGLCINTINENFDLDIQNYIQVDFGGFQKIIDELGGINLDLTLKEATYINKNCNSQVLEKDGVQLLNGEQTLCHCRNRKTGDGDFGRTRRQRDVILAIFNRIKSVNDAVKISQLLFNSLDYIKTNMTPDMLFTLGTEMIGAKKISMQQGSIPFDKTWSYANMNGRSVISINLNKNKDQLYKFLYGKS